MTTKLAPIIRKGSTEDCLLLANLGERTFVGAFGDQNSPEDMAAYLSEAFGPEKQASELADPAVIFLIAEINENAVGYVKLQGGKPPGCVTGGSPVEIARIYVLREFLGKGIGDALMDSAITWATAGGYGTLWLGVWERNERAQTFYRKWGFVVAGTHFFQLGSDKQTDLLMERSLRASSTVSEAVQQSRK